MNKKIPVLLLLGLTFNPALAQEQLKNVEVTVLDRYKGRIAESVKISRNADFIDTTDTKIPVSYRVPTSALQFSFRPEPLKPMLISKVPVEDLPKHHIDLGFGNYGLFTAHASTSGGRSSKRQWGIELDHMNLNGGVQDIVFEENPFFRSRINAHLFNYLDGWKLSNTVEGNFNGIRYYGFPEGSSSLDSTMQNEAIQQRYTQFGWKGGYNRIKNAENKSAFNGLGAGYYHFFDRFGNSENQMEVSADGQVNLSGSLLELGLNIEHFATQFDSISAISQSYTQLRLEPRLASQWQDFKFELGLNLGYNGYTIPIKGGSDGSFFVLPAFSANYTFVPSYLSAFAQWNGRIDNTSYSELSALNPYIYPSIQQNASKYNTFELGLKGRVTQKLAFQLSASYELVDGLPLFYRDPYYADSTGTPGFSVLYDNADLLKLRGELGYLSETWNFKANVEFIHYSMDRLEAPFHLPSFTAEFSGNYPINKKLRAGARANYVGSRTAFQSELNTSLESELKGFFDLGIEATYAYNDYLGATLFFDNLLAQRYQLWLGYPVVGFQAGLQLSYRF
jgi:hypothetical protein